MSGMANTAQSDILKLLFENTTWANVGDVTGIVGSTAAGNLYVALHTADPTNAGDQTSSETSYTNYARIPVSRAAGSWDISGTSPTTIANHSAVTFAACGVTGATLTHFSVGRASSGTGEILVSGALGASLIVNPGITPAFAAGALTTTVD